MAGYETVGRRFLVVGPHQFRIVGMEFDVAQAERMVLHVAERLRLRFVVAHEVGIFRMTRNVAAIVRMGRNRAHGLRRLQLRMRELGEIRMARIVAQQRRMSRNAAHRLSTRIGSCCNSDDFIEDNDKLRANSHFQCLPDMKSGYCGCPATLQRSCGWAGIVQMGSDGFSCGCENLGKSGWRG